MCVYGTYDDSVAEAVKPRPRVMRAALSAAAIAPNAPAIDPKGEAGKKKPPLGMVPRVAVEQESFALAHGAKKYGTANWRYTRVLASTYINAALRHLFAWAEGIDNDAESGLSHLAHARATLAILLDAAAVGSLHDDRSPPRKDKTEHGR